MRLLYITKDPAVGEIAEGAGVDWIFVDMEYRGKNERQANCDTVISNHTVKDVRAIRSVLCRSQLMVRVNPLGAWSREEIGDVIEAGADIVGIVEAVADQGEGGGGHSGYPRLNVGCGV